MYLVQDPWVENRSDALISVVPGEKKEWRRGLYLWLITGMSSSCAEVSIQFEQSYDDNVALEDVVS